MIDTPEGRVPCGREPGGGGGARRHPDRGAQGPGSGPGLPEYLRWKSVAKGFRYGSISRSRASSGTSAKAASRGASEPLSPAAGAAGAAIFAAARVAEAREGRVARAEERERLGAARGGGAEPGEPRRAAATGPL